MSKEPVVTVLMPVYNASGFVLEAVKSILTQSFTDFELLIIDDGSTDSSMAELAGIADPRVRLEKNEKNLGLIATLNRGLELARGEFVARMDADDLSLPTRLEKQVTFLREHPEIGVCGTATETFGFGSPQINTYLQTHEQLTTLLVFNSCLSHPSIMFRKSIADLRYDADFKHAEDYELWTRLMTQTRFVSLPEVLLKYRIHAAQVTSKQRDAVREMAMRVRRNVIARLDLSPTREEMQVHNQLSNSETIRGKEAILLLENWLTKLIAANNQKKLFDPIFFQTYLAKIWIDACANAGIGMHAQKMAWLSPLAQHADRSFKQRLKFVLKLLIRR
jgi:glycosyltransferase involved in cell wall biosynthesis